MASWAEKMIPLNSSSATKMTAMIAQSQKCTKHDDSRYILLTLNNIAQLSHLIFVVSY